MTLMPTITDRVLAVRSGAVALLVLAWVVAVAADGIGSPTHALAPKLVTAFLLWRVWRGADWSCWLLIALSVVSAGFAIGLGLVIALGASGISTATLTMFALYPLVGLLLCAPAVRQLSRRAI